MYELMLPLTLTYPQREKVQFVLKCCNSYYGDESLLRCWMELAANRGFVDILRNIYSSTSFRDQPYYGQVVSISIHEAVCKGQLEAVRYLTELRPQSINSRILKDSYYAYKNFEIFECLITRADSVHLTNFIRHARVSKLNEWQLLSKIGTFKSLYFFADYPELICPL